MRRKSFAKTFALLGFIALGLAALYIFEGLGARENWGYNISRRADILVAISIVACAVGVSSIIFQTITSNRILTPGIMGLDNLYLFTQTIIIYFFSSDNSGIMSGGLDFFLTLILMLVLSIGLYLYIFKSNSGDVFFVVLTGLVFGIGFGGMSNFMQVIIDPSEFSILEGRMFASFNKINLPLMGISGLIVLFAFLWLFSDFDKFDAITLGRDSAVSLGVEYDKVVLKSLAAVSLFTCASTVLVGPVTFLGIIIASITRFIFPTYRHSVLLSGSILVGIIALVFGMLATERVLQFSVPLSVIINFVGGIYFIYLVLKVKRV